MLSGLEIYDILQHLCDGQYLNMLTQYPLKLEICLSSVKEFSNLSFYELSQ